jgi:hypothetical protein
MRFVDGGVRDTSAGPRLLITGIGPEEPGLWIDYPAHWTPEYVVVLNREQVNYYLDVVEITDETF